MMGDELTYPKLSITSASLLRTSLNQGQVANNTINIIFTAPADIPLVKLVVEIYAPNGAKVFVTEHPLSGSGGGALSVIIPAVPTAMIGKYDVFAAIIYSIAAYTKNHEPCNPFAPVDLAYSVVPNSPLARITSGKITPLTFTQAKGPNNANLDLAFDTTLDRIPSFKYERLNALKQILYTSSITATKFSNIVPVPLTETGQFTLRCYVYDTLYGAWSLPYDVVYRVY